MTKVGFLNPPSSHAHMVSYTYDKFMESISAINSVKIVPWADADYVFCMYNDWSSIHNAIELETDAKIISHAFDCRKVYRGKLFTGVLKQGDAIWLGGEYLDGLGKIEGLKEGCNAYHLPVGTWSEPFSEKEIDVSMTMSPSSKERKIKTKEFINKNKEMNFKADLTRSKPEDWGIPNSKNVSYGKEIGSHVFNRAKFNLEIASKIQKDIGFEYKFWSDRQGIATSNFCHVITNYTPTLENWESAISVKEKPEYDRKSLEADIKKWDWKRMIEELLKETLMVI